MFCVIYSLGKGIRLISVRTTAASSVRRNGYENVLHCAGEPVGEWVQ